MLWNFKNLKATLLLLCCFCVEIYGGSSVQAYRDLSRDYRDAVSSFNTEILDGNDTGVLLKCELKGVFPRAVVTWQDDKGTMIPPSERCYRRKSCNISITAHVNKTETNNFYCVVRQPEIYHEFKKKIHVPDKMFQVLKNDTNSDVSGLSTGGWIGIVVASLVAGLIGGGLSGVIGTLKWIKRRYLSTLMDEDPQFAPANTSLLH